MTKTAQEAANRMLEKLSGYTEHGTANEKARAKAFAQLAEDYEQANQESPGMTYLKGTQIRPAIHKLLARKGAYRSQQEGAENLKAAIPFVGMGSAGQRALDKVRQG